MLALSGLSSCSSYSYLFPLSVYHLHVRSSAADAEKSHNNLFNICYFLEMILQFDIYILWLLICDVSFQK